MGEIPEGALNRVQKLLDLAAEHDRSGSHAERDACLHRADEIMNKHRIEQAVIDARRALRGESQREIVRVDLDFPYNEWSDQVIALMRYFAAHGMVQAARIWDRASIKEKLALVGFSDDIEYVRQLWLGAVNTMIAKISPSWDSSLPFDANVKRLKDAAYKWVEIAHMANKNGHKGSTTNGDWLRRAYERQCHLEGVAPTRQTQRHGAYRQSFVNSFVYEVDRRLRELEKERARQNDAYSRKEASENLPALRSAEDRVKAEFYKHFPSASPEAAAKRREKYLTERQMLLDSMSPEERRKFESEQAKNEARLKREYDRKINQGFDPAGYDAGRQAGSEVDIFGSRNKLGGQRREIES